MTFDQLFALVLVVAAVIVAICLAHMWRADLDAEIGRELRLSAGSAAGVRMAIESANLDRLLEQKFDRVMAKLPHRLPANVARIAPRILNRGRVVRFEPTDGAA